MRDSSNYINNSNRTEYTGRTSNVSFEQGTNTFRTPGPSSFSHQMGAQIQIKGSKRGLTNFGLEIDNILSGFAKEFFEMFIKDVRNRTLSALRARRMTTRTTKSPNGLEQSVSTDPYFGKVVGTKYTTVKFDVGRGVAYAGVHDLPKNSYMTFSSKGRAMSFSVDKWPRGQGVATTRKIKTRYYFSKIKYQGTAFFSGSLDRALENMDKLVPRAINKYKIKR